MSANSRMTVAIHVLSYMTSAASKNLEPVTSDQIAYSVATNPVVIRRMLGLLQKAGLVSSRRGAHAGWMLARKPSAITLLDVYHAVEDQPLFAMHASPPNRACHIARGIQPALRQAYGRLEEGLHRQLAGISIAEIFTEITG
jgi:Rrf2 family protein